MSIVGLLSRMGVLFAFLAVGLLCAKLGWLDEHGGKSLNKLVLNVFAPCIVLASVLSTELEYAVGDIMTLLCEGEASQAQGEAQASARLGEAQTDAASTAQGAALNALQLALGFVCALIFFRRDKNRSQFHLLTAFGNTVFMGFPVVASILGDDAIFLASMCSIPFNLFIYSIGVLLAGGKGSLKQFLLRLLNPPFLANFVGLALFLLPIRAPEPVIEVFDALGGMVVPLSMMLIGMSLARLSLRAIFSDWRVYVLAGCRLLLAPVVIFLVMRLFVRDVLFLDLFVILAAMPCASVLPILCGEYGGDEALASKCVFVTTLLSLATVPLMLGILLK